MSTEELDDVEEIDPSKSVYEWTQHRLAGHQPPPAPGLVCNIADADSEWGHAAHRAGIPDEHLAGTLEALEAAMIRDLDREALLDLEPESPIVVAWLAEAAKELR